MASRLKIYLRNCLRELTAQGIDELLDARYQKFRRIGAFLEGPAAVEQNILTDGPAAAGPHFRPEPVLVEPEQNH